MLTAGPNSPRTWPGARHACFLALGVMLLAGCRPCNTLDERLCERLGPEDCALWQGPMHRAGSPSQHEGSDGSLRNTLKGRGLVEKLLYGENGRMCNNALERFDEVAGGIEASVRARKPAGGQ